MLTGAKRDGPTVNPDHSLVRTYIDGVVVHDVRNIVTRNSLTTEAYRNDWPGAAASLAQTIVVDLRQGAVSAWHMHLAQRDHFFVVSGALKAVFYDDREGSPTRGRVDELFLDRARPCLVGLPPGVWHGVAAMGGAGATFLNFQDRLFDHAGPDFWRLPPDSEAIPYRF
ncbi:MAG: dTDP-4-dehydrorhamnose 3,5-epimerase family protein [Burkholderiales bacterium]|jgi:dTDP-4-dehydrorhamnose 3,5-epimerase|nr:dTDP-4-dehydrorhamnose 3,5-epimerase family protein [Burkholderiales bacterium]